MHIKPSFFVKSTRIYKHWCSIGVCINCGLTGKREDLHPAHPCPNCGEKVVDRVGKWIKTSKWWHLRERGYWMVKI